MTMLNITSMLQRLRALALHAPHMSCDVTHWPEEALPDTCIIKSTILLKNDTIVINNLVIFTFMLDVIVVYMYLLILVKSIVNI